ncbi:hypothetical protein FJTKL_11222 [Diaporthe vaccinii]|uniref:Uncharacterized protein n=1 Tax=Diaporthe vaccinii TaxID=105482 RepID=A0ABR4EI24_9PEZI
MSGKAYNFQNHKGSSLKKSYNAFRHLCCIVLRASRALRETAPGCFAIQTRWMRSIRRLPGIHRTMRGHQLWCQRDRLHKDFPRLRDLSRIWLSR